MINILKIILGVFNFFAQFVFSMLPIWSACIVVSHRYKAELEEINNIVVLALLTIIFPFFAPAFAILLLWFLDKADLNRLAICLEFLFLSFLFLYMTAKLPVLTVGIAIHLMYACLFAGSDSTWVRSLVMVGCCCNVGLGVYALAVNESVIALQAQKIIGPKVAKLVILMSAKVYEGFQGLSKEVTPDKKEEMNYILA